MRALLVSTACSLLLLAASSAWAQTDADKATARTLAQEGIELKKEGKYDEALEKFQKAQGIFDAPTHLLLIGQCQVALGKLVEGAETYRRLVRRKLDDKAPAAFRQAQEIAAKELAAVEPRIPKIRIQLVPENVQGYEVRIDGVQVPSGVVGVDRLANPGHHVVEVTAPGYETAKVQLQLTEGQVLPVEVKLERDGTPIAPPAPAPAKKSYATPQPDSPEKKKAKRDDDALNLLLTARLKTAFPGGEFGTASFEEFGEVEGGNVADSFGPGGGVELQGGLRFSDNWAGMVYLGVDGFGKVSSDDYGVDLEVLYPGALEFEAKESSAPYVGIGGQWYSCPDCLGVLVELGLMARFFTQTVAFRPDGASDNSCEVQISRSTPMVRFLAGLQVPVGAETVLTPFTSFEGGGVSTMRIEPSADNPSECQEGSFESTETGSSSSVHVLTVGLSGTMSFGI